MVKDFLNLKVDKPIENEEEDKLGHNKIYVEPIYNILNSNNKNLSLGIFGNFGSGKTSIINLLKKRYSSRSEISFIKSSIWGHSPPDALKKIFLDIGKEKEFNKRKELESDLFDSKEGIDKTKFKLNNLKFLTYFIVFFIMVLFVSRFISFLFLSDYITWSIGIGTIIVMILLAYFGVSTVSIKKKTPPMHLSNFEFIWKRLIKTLKDGKKEELILVIDDLDRCEDLEDMILILDKLNSLMEITGGYIKIKIILLFSLSSYIQKEEKPNLIYSNIEKFLDTFIWLAEPTKSELYKLTQGVRND